VIEPVNAKNLAGSCHQSKRKYDCNIEADIAQLISNKADLRHLLTLFAGFQTVDEGHRLFALVFGAQKARHFSFDHIRESERIDLSPYDEPPMEYPLQPRTRSYKPRMDRTGFADKTADS